MQIFKTHVRSDLVGLQSNFDGLQQDSDGLQSTLTGLRRTPANVQRTLTSPTGLQESDWTSSDVWWSPPNGRTSDRRPSDSDGLQKTLV